jgi:nitroreductase
MTIEGDPGAAAQSTALAEAAAVAGYAPSIHNTQPWIWRVRASSLELHTERGRQLTATDPEGRMMVVSCGAALHHVRVALAAEGWQTQVVRFPEPADPDLLARLTLTGQTPVNAAAMRLLQTIEIRHTDRRPVTGTPVSDQALDGIRHAIEAEGARLHLLRPDDVLELAAAATRAQEAEALDPQWQAEMSYWAGGSRRDGLGIPDEAIPVAAPQTTVPGRDFGHAGTLPVSAGHDRAAVYAVLYGDEDAPQGWLRGGEALSAGWLKATELAASIVPMSAAIEVTTTRQTLRRLLSHLGHPYLVLRFGLADPDQAGPPRTPRLPAAQVVEMVNDGDTGATG